MIYTITEYLSITATILTLIVALLKNKTLKFSMRVLFLYVITSAIIEVLIVSFAKMSIPNLQLIKLFTIVEFTFLGLFYLKFFRSKIHLWLIYVTLFCFYGLSLYHVLSVDQGSNIFISLSAIEGLALISLSVICFYELIKKIEYTSIFENPIFWVNSSILIYFSGNLFLFIFSNYILHEPDNRVWILHNILNIFFNTLLIVAFWKTSKR